MYSEVCRRPALHRAPNAAAPARTPAKLEMDGRLVNCRLPGLGHNVWPGQAGASPDASGKRHSGVNAGIRALGKCGGSTPGAPRRTHARRAGPLRAFSAATSPGAHTSVRCGGTARDAKPRSTPPLPQPRPERRRLSCLPPACPASSSRNRWRRGARATDLRARP